MITFDFALNDNYCNMGMYKIFYYKHLIMYYQQIKVYRKFISCRNILSKT